MPFCLRNATPSVPGTTPNWRNTPLEGITAVLGNHHYEDVRRVTGDHAVVEEHRAVSITPSGHAVNLAACVVVRVNDAGLITSLDEYVDLSRFPTGG